MRIRSFLTALLGLAVVAGAPSVAQQVEGVAAIVNDEVISTYDVRQRMRLILASTAVQPNPDAPDPVPDLGQRDIVRQGIRGESVLSW